MSLQPINLHIPATSSIIAFLSLKCDALPLQKIFVDFASCGAPNFHPVLVECGPDAVTLVCGFSIDGVTQIYEHNANASCGPDNPRNVCHLDAPKLTAKKAALTPNLSKWLAAEVEEVEVLKSRRAWARGSSKHVLKYRFWSRMVWHRVLQSTWWA